MNERHALFVKMQHLIKDKAITEKEIYILDRLIYSYSSEDLVFAKELINTLAI